MGQLLLILAGALTVAAVVFGAVVLVTGNDPGLAPAEPDGRAVPLPANRPVREEDVAGVRFDTALRGYRMNQVDQAMSRAAYDIGYKDELIGVLEAEVVALREGRTGDADALRDAREAAAASTRVVDPDVAASTSQVFDPEADAVHDGERPADDERPAAPVDPAADGNSGAGPAADPETATGADGTPAAVAGPDEEARDVSAADPFTRPTVELPGTPVRSERA